MTFFKDENSGNRVYEKLDRRELEAGINGEYLQ